MRGIEPRTLPCKGSVFPLVPHPRGAAGKARTCDFFHVKEVLCPTELQQLGEADGIRTHGQRFIRTQHAYRRAPASWSTGLDSNQQFLSYQDRALTIKLPVGGGFFSRQAKIPPDASFYLVALEGPWWTLRVSNPPPLRCERSALPTELNAQVPGFSYVPGKRPIWPVSFASQCLLWAADAVQGSRGGSTHQYSSCPVSRAVEPEGFEPSTFSMPWSCSPIRATAPNAPPFGPAYCGATRRSRERPDETAPASVPAAGTVGGDRTRSLRLMRALLHH